MATTSAPATIPATERGARSRRRLLDAAARELVRNDGQVEVAAVAARARVSVGLVYRWFGSKAGLVSAVVEDFYDRLDAEVFDIDPAPDADWGTRERIRTHLGVRFHYADPLAPVILDRLAREPEVAAVEARRIARHVELAARNIARGQASGELPPELDPGLVGAMVLGGFRQALGQVLARRGAKRPSADRLGDELWRFIAGAVRFQPVQ